MGKICFCINEMEIVNRVQSTENRCRRGRPMCLPKKLKVQSGKLIEIFRFAQNDSIAACAM